MPDALRECRYTAVIFFLILILLGLGLSMVYSSSAVWDATNTHRAIEKQYQVRDQIFPSFHSTKTASKQVMWIILGMISLFIFYSLDYEAVTRHHWAILGLAIFLLVLVLFVGKEINGAKRWINLGPMNFQPSEFAKLALVIFLSRFVYDNKDRLDDLKHFYLPCIGIVSLVLGLIVLERDFGATMVAFCVAFAILYMGRVPLKYLFVTGLAALPPFICLIIFFPYRMKRIFSFLWPDADPLGVGWQLNQSLISVGSGGIWGKGLGMGAQKYRFLSESHTDFIYAMIGEELGLIGTLFVLLIFCLLVGTCFRVAMKTQHFHAAMIAGGISSLIGIPALIHIGVDIGALPPKGLALPFISYGGTSMLVNLTSMGILMSIARNVDYKVAQETPKRARAKKQKTKQQAPIWVRA